MSASAAVAGAHAFDARTVRIFRYAGGSTLAMAVALGVDWQLSFLVPVLTLSYLGSPAPRPTLVRGVGFVAVVAGAAAVGLAMTATLLPYPAVMLLLVAAVLFRLFHRANRGASPVPTIMLMIAVTVIPVVGVQSVALAAVVAKSLVVGAAVTIGVVWVAHTVFPDPPHARATDGAAPAAPPPPSHVVAGRRAAVSTLVVMPLVTLYFALGLTSVLVLVFVAVLSMQPDFARGFQAGKALIVGNTLGGISAILMYDLLVMVPQFVFMLMLTLLFGLFFGRLLYSDRPAAKLFGMAYSTMILVVASTTSMYGDADAKALTRVLQITAAVVYFAVTFGVIARLRKRAGSDAVA